MQGKRACSDGARRVRGRWPAIVLAAACASAGCGPDGLGGSGHGVGKGQPSQRADDGNGPVMAVVNGEPVYMRRLHEVLIRGRGLVMAQQLIADEVVNQAARRGGVSVTDEQVQQEHQRLLESIFPGVAEPEQRDRLLGQFLAEKGMSLVRWDMIARRNAMLRELAGPRVKVTDEQVQQAYADKYGRRVVVRHIELESLNAVERILTALKDGGDFAQLARKHSRNPSGKQGGLLPAMSKTAPEQMPEAIRKVALALTKPGEVSDPVKVGYAYHVLRLERVIEPGGAKFEDVKDQLRADVREQAIRQAQQHILMELMSKAKHEFVDPLLRSLSAEASSTD